MDKQELCWRNNPYSLFRKYKELITLLARKHAIFREFVAGDSNLVIPKNVALLLPNGFHEFDGMQGRLTVSTRPIYSPQLSPILGQLDNLVSVGKIEHFGQAEEIVMYLTGETNKIPRFAPYREMPRVLTEVMFATTGDLYSVSGGDGSIYNDNAGTYATCRGLTTGTTNAAGDPVNLYASRFTSFSISRGYTPFDTSSIGAGALSIDSGTFKFTVATAVAGSPTFHLGQTNQASGSSLAAGDYDNWTGLTGVITSGGSVAAGTTGQKTITLNGTALTWVSKTSYSLLGIVEQGDQQNSDPGAVDNRDSINMGENATPANRPTLNITYTPAAAGGWQEELDGGTTGFQSY